MVGVDSFRASGGGWVRLVFKNINGAPLDKVEIAKVRAGQLNHSCSAVMALNIPYHGLRRLSSTVLL